MDTDQEPDTTAPFSARSAADRITGYMWYIHVLVRANSEHQVRTRLAPLLHRPSDDDLTDHLVLWAFDRALLARLAARPPALEHADGYARALADVVPDVFREDFCRRLYRLVFRRRLVEWPRGVADPGPAEDDDAPRAVELEDACPEPRVLEGGGPPRQQQEIDDDDDDDERPSITASAPDESVCTWTPSPSAWDRDEQRMCRGGYFGTVASPMADTYWPRSRDSYDHASASMEGKEDQRQEEGRASYGWRPRTPFPSPRPRGVTPDVGFQVSTW